jgi:tRNA U38,U39,U40 pseudouridine synthase TruA
MNCLSELESIILELKRIASRRRFMRHRILDIANQLNNVAYWILWAYDRNATRPQMIPYHLDEDLEEALDDLVGVIHYKKFMRRECWNVYKRIRHVQSFVYATIVRADIDGDAYWATHVFGRL